MKNYLLYFLVIFLSLAFQNTKAEEVEAANPNPYIEKKMYFYSDIEKCRQQFAIVEPGPKCGDVADGTNNSTLVKRADWKDLYGSEDPEAEILDLGFARYESTPCKSSFSIKRDGNWESANQATFCKTIMENSPVHIWQSGCC